MLILALEHVDLMQDVKSLITAQFVHVHQDNREIHSRDVLRLLEILKLKKEKILVYQILVDPIRYAESMAITQVVSVLPAMLETRQIADQNVSSTLTALMIKFVAIINAQILVLESVVQTLFVKSLQMLSLVHVQNDLPEMLLFNVYLIQFNKNHWIHVNHLLVDRTLNA